MRTPPGRRVWRAGRRRRGRLRAPRSCAAASNGSGASGSPRRTGPCGAQDHGDADMRMRRVSSAPAEVHDGSASRGSRRQRQQTKKRLGHLSSFAGWARFSSRDLILAGARRYHWQHLDNGVIRNFLCPSAEDRPHSLAPPHHAHLHSPGGEENQPNNNKRLSRGTLAC